MNPLIERVIRYKSIKHENGKLYVWGIPSILTAVHVILFLTKLVEHESGVKKAIKIFYNLGRMQAKYGTRIMTERFGYKLKLQDKKKLVKNVLFHSELLGYGKCRIKIFDTEKNLFVIVGKSSISEEFRKFFSGRKHIDHYLRGCIAGIFEAVLGEKYFCIETKCVANNDNICEFVIRPPDRFDKSGPLFKSQYCSEISEFNELNLSHESFIMPSK